MTISHAHTPTAGWRTRKELEEAAIYDQSCDPCENPKSEFNLGLGWDGIGRGLGLGLGLGLAAKRRAKREETFQGKESVRCEKKKGGD